MIGGTDIVIDTGLNEIALDVAVRCARNAWPEAVFEDADTGNRSDHYEDLSFGRITELFVFRDARTAEDWDEHGAVQSLVNTMIHVLVGPDSLTVVVDDPDTSEMRQILATIRESLRMDIFNTLATLGAAA
jgi:hypothetical protein